MEDLDKVTKQLCVKIITLYFNFLTICGAILYCYLNRNNYNVYYKNY